MARKLKAQLDLETARANRNAKELKKNLGNVDKGLRDTGKSSKQTFGGLASGALKGAAAIAGVSLGIGGVATVLEKVRRILVEIAQAQADLAKAEQQRMRGSAATAGQPLWRELGEYMGVTPREARERATRASMAVGGAITPEAWGGAGLRVHALMPKPLREPMMDAITKVAVAYGMDVPPGMAPVTLREQFGFRGAPAIREGLADLGAAAKVSAHRAGEFAGILPEVAPSLKQAGLGYEEQLAFITGFSTFTPTKPDLTRTSLEILSRLSMRKPPIVKKLLKQAGFDPNTRNLRQILDAIAKYLQAGGDVETLASGTGIDVRVLRNILRYSTGGFEKAYGEAKEAMAETTWADVEAKAAAKAVTPEAEYRAAGLATELPQMEMGEPGTFTEASRLADVYSMRAAGAPGYQEAMLAFSREMAEKPEALQPDVAEKLYRLNAVCDMVLPSLDRVLTATIPETHPETRTGKHDYSPFYDECRLLRDRLLEARGNANQHHVWGEQLQYIAPYENALREAIQFLRKVQLGEGVAALHKPSWRWQATRLPPTAAMREAAVPDTESFDQPWPGDWEEHHNRSGKWDFLPGGYRVPKGAATPTTQPATQPAGKEVSVLNVGVMYNRTPLELALNPYSRIG